MNALKLANAMLFLSTLSLRRATAGCTLESCYNSYFYPRSPCGERRCAMPFRLFQRPISIHALLAESDRCFRNDAQYTQRFLSTLSLRRATRAEHHANSQQEFLSTLSLRRATSTIGLSKLEKPISIHALLAESDRKQPTGQEVTKIFLSTLSLRRATLRMGCRASFSMISIHALLAESDAIQNAKIDKLNNFYPRSPCGERPRTQSASLSA